MMKGNYNDMIESIIKEFGNDSYNVKKCLENEITNNLESGMKFMTFEMNGLKFEMIRDLITIKGEEELLEQWSWLMPC